MTTLKKKKWIWLYKLFTWKASYKLQATLATLQMTKTITMVSSNTDMVLSLRWREARTIRDLKNFFYWGNFYRENFRFDMYKLWNRFVCHRVKQLILNLYSLNLYIQGQDRIGSLSHFFSFFFFHVLNHANLQRNFFLVWGGIIPYLKVKIFWTFKGKTL